MRLLGSLLALSVVSSLALGCGHTSDDPVARAQARQRKIALAQCQASLDVFLPGMRPERPYRVIGPVEGNWAFTV